jgi:transcriptional regulator with XRE-family HTH domain
MKNKNETKRAIVGERIRLARVVQRLTHADVARHLKVSQPMISYFETVIILPGRAIREKLGEVLNVPDSIFEEDV